MSDPADRTSAKTRRRWGELLRAMEYQRRRAKDEAKQLHNHRDEIVRQWLMRHVEQTQPEPGQQCGTLLGSMIGLKKRSGMAMFKLVAGDVELAEKMAKQNDLPFDRCLEAIIEVNRLNTPSYLGGDSIQKGDQVKTKKQLKKQSQLVQFVVNHKITGSDPELDKAVWALNYRAALGRPIGQAPGQPVSSALGLLTATR